jgi:hypothetical protein
MVDRLPTYAGLRPFMREAEHLPPMTTREEIGNAILGKSGALGLRARGIAFESDRSVVVTLEPPVDSTAWVELMSFAQRGGVTLGWTDGAASPDA